MTAVALSPVRSSCRVTVSTAACGAPATRLVTFVDGDTVAACQECAVRMELMAQCHGTSVRVERMEAT